MKTILLVLIGLIFSCLSYSQGKIEASTSVSNNPTFNEYSMTLAGVKNDADIKKVIGAFESKKGIIHAQVDSRTFVLSVITKDYITIENVYDVLRTVGSKTDNYLLEKLDQRQVDAIIK